MVSSVRLIAIALVVAVFAICVVSAKECYDCNSKDACSKGTTNVTCAKDCIKVDNKKGETVMKGCADSEFCDLYRYCYLCKDDRCNSSSSISPSFVIMGIIGALVAKYYM